MKAPSKTIRTEEMCKQAYVACLNRNCNGFAQTLALLPCQNRPNCELEYARVPRSGGSAEAYCPDCRNTTKEERRKQVRNTWNAARKAKRDSARVLKGGPNVAAHAAVEQTAESSTTEAGRGAFVGGEFFLPDPGLPFSISEWAVESGPVNQTAANTPTPPLLNMGPPQSPVHPPRSPQIPIDPIADSNNGRDPIENSQDAGVGPKSSNPKKPSERKEN